MRYIKWLSLLMALLLLCAMLPAGLSEDGEVIQIAEDAEAAFSSDEEAVELDEGLFQIVP